MMRSDNGFFGPQEAQLLQPSLPTRVLDAVWTQSRSKSQNTRGGGKNEKHAKNTKSERANAMFNVTFQIT